MKDRQFGRLRFIGGENRGKYPYNHSLNKLTNFFRKGARFIGLPILL